jgi:hypothetical protein
MVEPVRLAAVNDGEEQRLPRNVEAEAAFLGALMIDNRVIEELSRSSCGPSISSSRCTGASSNAYPPAASIATCSSPR